MYDDGYEPVTVESLKRYAEHLSRPDQYTQRRGSPRPSRVVLSDPFEMRTIPQHTLALDLVHWWDR